MGRKSIAAWKAVLVVTSGSARGVIIVDQPPVLAGGPGGDTAYVNDVGVNSWEVSADEFIAPASVSIGRIVWWGFYGGNSPASSVQPPVGDETMRIRTYAPRPEDGLPGDIIHETAILNATRSFTGRFYGPHPEFRFETTLDMPLAIGQSVHYWLEIVQVGDMASWYRRSYTPDYDTPLAYINPYVVDWQRVPLGGLAFQLWAVPEPGPIWAIAMALGLGICRRGRRREAAR